MTWTVLWDGYNEEFTDNAGSADLRVLCLWSDRSAVRSALIGSAHSDYSGLKCNTVRIAELLKVEEGTSGPKEVILEIGYKDLATSMQQGSSAASAMGALSDWVEEWDIHVEAIKLGYGYHWATNPQNNLKDTDAQAVMLYPEAAVTLTGGARTGIATGKGLIHAAVGCINESALTLKDYTYASDTLLFMGAQLQENRGVDSDYYTITYRFLYRGDCTWNQAWREDKPGGAGWDGISDEIALPPYVSIPFSDLDPKNWTP